MATLRERWGSEPMPRGRPGGRKSVPGKMPSPRLAWVLRHRPATAPLRAIAATSAGSAWVAWTRHQRWSTATFSYSHATADDL